MKNRDLKITFVTLSNNKLLIRITMMNSSNDNTQGHLTEPWTARKEGFPLHLPKNSPL